MFKKLIAMALSASMILSCALVAGAASAPEQSVNEDGDIVYVYDSFTIVISDGPAAQSRATITEEDTGVATVDDPGTYDLGFPDNIYTQASITIENVDDEAGMYFEILGTVNKEPVSVKVKNLKPGDNRIVRFTANDGTTLSGGIDVTIEPYNADSVAYYYVSRKS